MPMKSQTTTTTNTLTKTSTVTTTTATPTTTGTTASSTPTTMVATGAALVKTMTTTINSVLLNNTLTTTKTTNKLQQQPLSPPKPVVPQKLPKVNKMKIFAKPKTKRICVPSIEKIFFVTINNSITHKKIDLNSIKNSPQKQIKKFTNYQSSQPKKCYIIIIICNTTQLENCSPQPPQSQNHGLGIQQYILAFQRIFFFVFGFLFLFRVFFFHLCLSLTKRKKK